MMIKLYIKNIDAIDKKIKCGKRLAEFLIKRGFYPLSKIGKDYYFSDTYSLQKVLKSMNFLQKIFYK